MPDPNRFVSFTAAREYEAVRKGLARDEVKEKFRYHSVTRNLSVEDAHVVSFPYRPAQLPELHKVDADEGEGRVRFAQAIPQDGRIQLPFDFRWRLTEAVAFWKLDYWSNVLSTASYRSVLRLVQKLPPQEKFIFPSELHSAEGAELLETHTLGERKSETKHLESFFSQDFQDNSLFIVYDFDPSSAAHVLFDLGGHGGAKALVPKSAQDTENGMDKFSSNIIYEHADILDWMATQKLFCQVHLPKNGIALWRRIILCRGLEFASPEAKKKRCFPFIAFRNSDPVRDAASMHLKAECKGGSVGTNPYFDPANAFHLVFFERVQDVLEYRCMKERDDLKLGRLYSRSHGANDEYFGKAFRRSSFTVLTATGRPAESQSPESVFESEWYWTMLILSPLFAINYSNSTDSEVAEEWTIAARQASRQTAELSCIMHALKNIVNGWRDLNDYIGALLAEDFMDPAEYCQLLFDDATFSRSRLYFWTIGCLNEFDALVEDSITQLKLYRLARVESILNRPDTPKGSSTRPTGKAPCSAFNAAEDRRRLKELDMQAQQTAHELETLRKQFQAKKEKALALRDGLFNASALMESRSSTRLGMNVQLLTYVSIFYLPLAFCAALWAIPDIASHHTQIPFVATAVLVGFATYLAVFNLENMAQLLGRRYSVLKKILLQKMEDEKDKTWKERRARFEVFPPSEKRETPSEWWMLWYLLYRLPKQMSRLLNIVWEKMGGWWPMIRRPWTERLGRWKEKFLPFRRSRGASVSEEAA